ncbi:MAG: Swt1 family HEPN domain-containing protein [Promethearchaeota archaeon]
MIDFQEINPNIKSLYAFLKKYDIEEFFLTKDFEIILMEFDLDDLWKCIKDDIIRRSKVAILLPGYTGYVDKTFKIFLDLIYLKARDRFIHFLSQMINVFISIREIENFNFEELKQRLLDCGFSNDDLYQIERLRKNDNEKDILEVIKKIPLPTVLPNGIDVQKYEEIINQLMLPNRMFQFIFVCENILRKFIIQILKKNGYHSIDSIGHKKLSETIKKQRSQEETQKYLPIRGDHDIFYLDLIDLNKIIQHENIWNKCFKNKFKSQRWITERIESLYSLRNRVAHSSGYLTTDELKSVETYCREIIKQIDQYIK